MAALWDRLSDTPVHFPDCCPAISRPLLQTILDHLPAGPALTLSIGCGSGLLEAALLHVCNEISGPRIDLRGVEVDSCPSKHLPPELVARVQSTTSLYPDAVLATALLFVYPRQPTLLGSYFDACSDGVLETVVWLGHRSDWPDFEGQIRRRFVDLHLIAGPGLADYEVLVVASGLKAKTSD